MREVIDSGRRPGETWGKVSSGRNRRVLVKELCKGVEEEALEGVWWRGCPVVVPRIELVPDR